jgi:small nuclear ribonucleoprotein (snRNP)-like protein
LKHLVHFPHQHGQFKTSSTGSSILLLKLNTKFQAKANGSSL